MKKIMMLVMGTMLFLSWTLQAGSTIEPVPDAMASEVLLYINQYRASHKLPPLTMNAAVTREAIRHSQEMAIHKVPFGHTGFSQRMNHLHHAVDDMNGGAENVAYNYKTAQIVVDGWIHSPGHRRNIVGHYNLTGIGIVRDRAGKLYYTQLFVRTEKKPATHAHHVSKRHAHPYFFIG